MSTEKELMATDLTARELVAALLYAGGYAGGHATRPEDAFQAAGHFLVFARQVREAARPGPVAVTPPAPKPLTLGELGMGDKFVCHQRPVIGAVLLKTDEKDTDSVHAEGCEFACVCVVLASRNVDEVPVGCLWRLPPTTIVTRVPTEARP